MDNPKFAINEPVAVCTPDLAVVIPKTVVTERKYFHGNLARDAKGRICLSPVCWCYRVQDDPMLWYAEELLRPIGPDEYEDEPTEVEKEKCA